MGIHPSRIIGALRRFTLRLSAPGRRHLAKVRARIEDDTERPGLTDVDRERFIPGPVCPLKVYRVGPENPTVTIVFIHGFTLGADSYFAQVDFVREQFPDAASILVDLRGHGDTADTLVGQDNLTIDGTADDVEALIKAEAPTGPLILVGHSMGGMTAFSLIRRADDELRNRIVGCIAIDTAVHPMAAAGAAQILATKTGKAFISAVVDDPEHADELRADLNELLAPALAVTVFHRDGVDYDLVEFHAAMISKTPTPTFPGFYPDLRDHDELAVEEAIAGIPGYIIVGEQDKVTPIEQAEYINKIWPDAELIKVTKCGHMTILEAPSVVNVAIADLVEKTTDLQRRFPERKRARVDCDDAKEAREEYGDPLSASDGDKNHSEHEPCAEEQAKNS